MLLKSKLSSIVSKESKSTKYNILIIKLITKGQSKVGSVGGASSAGAAPKKEEKKVEKKEEPKKKE
jgi:hypothetical protein